MVAEFEQLALVMKEKLSTKKSKEKKKGKAKY
jgi:hypothetical protein